MRHRVAEILETVWWILVCLAALAGIVVLVLVALYQVTEGGPN